MYGRFYTLADSPVLSPVSYELRDRSSARSNTSDTRALCLRPPTGKMCSTVSVPNTMVHSLGNDIVLLFGCHTATVRGLAGTQGILSADVAGGGDAAGGRRPQTKEETGHGQVRLRAGSSLASTRCRGSESELICRASFATCLVL